MLSWSAPAAPNAAATDYHVNWAKSAEDYPADTAEAGNAHPTTTTHTLPDLEYDTDYNIRVRARYSDGENADSPWNGPWTETTAQVKLPLPAAPFIGATAVTPDGDVLLSWFNLEEDDSITGYQILRGPNAENLVVIEDDTGSSSNSYTDETPPAGQTHTYAVKGRNASGLGPQSDTGTATVPEPEEELVTAQQSSEETLVSNLIRGTSDASNAFVGPRLGITDQVAIPFTTGTNAPGYHLTSVQFKLRIHSDTPTLQVSIRGDNADLPGDTALYTLTTSSAITADYQLITFTTTDEVTLQPNTTYWLYVTATGGTANIQETGSDDEDTESQAGWRIGDVRLIKRYPGTRAVPWTRTPSDTGCFSENAYPARHRYQVAILGHVIPPPEPSD